MWSLGTSTLGAGAEAIYGDLQSATVKAASIIRRVLFASFLVMTALLVVVYIRSTKF